MTVGVGEGFEIGVVDGEEKSIEILDFFDHLFVNNVFDSIGSLSQNLVIGLHVWHFELHGNCPQIEVFIGLLFEKFFGDDCEDEGDLCFDGDINGDCIFIGHEDVQDLVDQILTLFGLFLRDAYVKFHLEAINIVSSGCVVGALAGRFSIERGLS